MNIVLFLQLLSALEDNINFRLFSEELADFNRYMRQNLDYLKTHNKNSFRVIAIFRSMITFTALSYLIAWIHLITTKFYTDNRYFIRLEKNINNVI